MDDSDLATAQEEVALIAALSRRKTSDIYINGQCWNCENHCAGLFCDPYCRMDWEKRDDADKRNGV